MGLCKCGRNRFVAWHYCEVNGVKDEIPSSVLVDENNKLIKCDKHEHATGWMGSEPFGPYRCANPKCDYNEMKLP